MFAKSQPRPLLENENFESATYIKYVIAKLLIFIKKQYTDPITVLFTEGSFKIKKGLELVSRSRFSSNFLLKIFVL